VKKNLLILILFLIGLFLFGVNVNAQNLVRFEHFFDTDPGYGSGTITNVTPAPTITNFDIPLSTGSLTPGFHKLYIRAQNASNVWTHTHIRDFYIVPLTTPTPNLTQLEYFFDTDPGIGLAIQVSFTAATTITNLPIDITTTSLTPGFHKLYVRTKTVDNKWTHTQVRDFYVLNAGTSQNIVKFEYFFDTDPGFDNGIAAPVAPPSPTVTDQDIFADVSALSIGAHTIYLRAKDSGGEWTQVSTGSFTVTVAPPPTITSFAPTSGPVGTTVVITGTNFSATPSNNIVNFNGTPAVVTASTATSITANVPVGATTGPITVTVAGNTANSTTNFIVTVCPIAPTAPPNQGCENTTVTLAASGGTNGQYRWYTVATGGTAISGETNSNYTTPILSATTTYYVVINDGTCESTRTAVAATINPLPSAPSTTGASACGPTASVLLTAAGGVAGQYRWHTVATGGTAITGETNSTYTTPTLSATTTYYVSINNGTCESIRASAIATITPLPTPPTTTGASICPATSATLVASGGTNGQYKWYSVSTGGTPMAGQSNSSFSTPPLSTTVTYYVTITIGVCESTRTPVTATILTAGCAPVITPQPLATQVEGKIVVDLKPLIATPGTLDVNSIKVVGQPSSGAIATVANGVLTIDYTGKPFSGIESITLEACNTNGTCSQQQFSIEVVGDITIYNAISANGDNKNPNFVLRYIEVLAETQSNKVSIFNRWGDVVWEGVNYNNTSVVFSGQNNNGGDLPSGTYFYKIEFGSGRKTETGYLSLKK
jgi:gliding motility-associated-like protein